MRIFYLVPLLALAGCDMSPTPDSVRRDFPVAAFNAVDVLGSYDVIVTGGGRPSVRAEGDAEAVDSLRISVRGDALTIRKRSRHLWGMGWMFGQDDGHTTVYVTVPTLSRVNAAGAGSITIENVRSDRFAATMAGAGEMRVTGLEAKDSEIVSAGAGSVMLSGRSDHGRLSLSGAGDLDASTLETRALDISLAGVGDVDARASESATVSLSGLGSVRVRGTTKCAISRHGLGDVHCGG